jgi:hypothetical protein
MVVVERELRKVGKYDKLILQDWVEYQFFEKDK